MLNEFSHRVEINPEIYHKTFGAMGTRLDIVLTDIPELHAETVCRDIKSTVKRLESILNPFDPTSKIFLINQRAFKKAVPVDEQLCKILKMCYRFHKLTNGDFDISLFKLSEWWRMNSNATTVDPDVQSHNLGMQHILIDDNQRTVRFANSDVAIDPGAFGKGLALEHVNGILEDYNVKNAFISFGESSVLARGTHPYGDCWQVGIQNVMKPEDIVYTVKLNNESLSTSGGYTRGTAYQRRYHIFDPCSGSLVRKPKTITVKSGSPLEAEVLSTALMVGTTETQLEICDRFPNCRVTQIDYHKNNNATITNLRDK